MNGDVTVFTQKHCSVLVDILQKMVSLSVSENGNF